MTQIPKISQPAENSANQQFLQQLVTPQSAPETAKPPTSVKRDYEHPLILKQGHLWSRAILWGVITILTGTVVWANVTELEEAVAAQGKLEPQGNVKEIQAPTQGVVQEILVTEGQAVKKGDRLLKLDPTTATAQLKSLQQVKQALGQENEYYATQLNGSNLATPPLQVSTSLLSLARNRSSLSDESRFLRAQLTGDNAGLSGDQQQRLKYKNSETRTRLEASELQAGQLERQLAQAQVKRSTAIETLSTNQGVLAQVKPLADQGGISKLQYLKQQQEVSANQSEVQQLDQEQQRLNLAIQEVKAKANNLDANDGKDNLAQISVNDQKIAEIDSQFTKAILENKKRISEIDSQIQQSTQLLKYGEIVAPVDGVIFEMKPKTPGYVTNVTEPLLKIVPQGNLIAQVSITNKDIGFITPGMEVDVRVDSFPFSEFGDVKGELIWIGSDAAQPTQTQPYFTFPAKIRLTEQRLMSHGKPVILQSGMSLSANIKTRKRKVIDVFTEQFKKGLESLKFVR